MSILVLTKAAIVSRLLLRLQSFVPVAKKRGGGWPRYTSFSSPASVSMSFTAAASVMCRGANSSLPIS